MNEADLVVLLHDWTVLGEYDAGYVVGRCAVCGREDLLELTALNLAA